MMIDRVALFVVQYGSRTLNLGVRHWKQLLILVMGMMLFAGCGMVSQEAVPLPPTTVPDEHSHAYTLAVQATNGQLDTLDHTLLADAYLMTGNRNAALAHYTAAAQVQNTPLAWQFVADNLLAQRDWVAAREALEAVLGTDPSNPTAHYKLGLLLAPHDAHLAYEYLTGTATTDQFGRAAEALQSAITVAELNAPSVQYLQIGMALASLEQWGLAEQSFALAVAFDPGYAEAWAYLGLARAQQDKTMALAFEQASLLAPTSPTVLLLAGLQKQMQGDTLAALQYLALAQEQEPQNPAIAAELGNVYRLLGDYSAAEQWLQTAATLAPDESQFMTLLALFYVEQTHDLTGKGFSVLQEAVTKQPENADLHAVYGWALFNRGEHTTAQETIAHARFLAPNNPRVLYYQGLIYQASNQNTLAIEVLLELLHHPAPQGFDDLARRALERLDHQLP